MDICPGVVLLDHITTLFLVFWETSILLFIMTLPIYIPTQSAEWGSLFSTLSLAFIICRLFLDCRLFADDHSDWCELLHCSFDLHFSNNEWCWASFHVPVGHLYLDLFSVGLRHCRVLPGSSASKESTCNAGEPGSIPGSGRSPGNGMGYLLQYSCLENSMDRGAWRAIVHGVAKNQTPLSDFHTFMRCSP